MDTPIEKSIDLLDKYPSVVERYFTPRYVVDVKTGEDHCILFHSNKICVITLAESHSVFREKKIVEKIDFKIGSKVDRMENKVKGKGKHGGQCVSENSVLCTIHCSDGIKYPVKSCVRGKLIEVNENLINNPHLLIDKTNTEGYIAVILQKLGDRSKVEENYLSKDAYLKLMH